MPSTIPPLEPSGRVARRDLAQNLQIWRMLAVAYLFLGGWCLALPLLWPSIFRPGPVAGVGALLLVVGGLAWRTAPPRADSIRSQLAVVSVPVCTALAMVAFGPSWPLAATALGFASALIPSRVSKRRLVIGHAALAAAIVAAAALAIDFSIGTLLILLSAISAFAGITAATTVVLEASARQGRSLHALVRTDGLTAVGSPRLLAERLQHAAARAGASGSIGLVTVDVDDLAEVNERLGPATGDRVLCAVANILSDLAAPQDTVARSGDDEFALLLPGADAARTREQVERAQAALDALAVRDHEVRASLGYACYPLDTRDPDLLLDIASTRLAVRKGHESPDDERGWQPTRLEPSPSPAAMRRRRPVAGIVEVRREALAANPYAWWLVSLGFGWFGVLGLLTALLGDSIQAGLVAACVCLFGIALSRSEPPALGSPLSHAVLLAIPVGTIALLPWAFDPAVVIGPLTCFGPLVALRLRDRREIAAHVAAAHVVVAPAAILLFPPPAVLMLGLLSFMTLLVLVADVIYLEIAEEQADELDALLRTDEQTGLGNQLRLSEDLERELLDPRHRAVALMTAVLAPTDGRHLRDRDARLAAGLVAAAVDGEGSVYRVAPHVMRVLLVGPGAERHVAVGNAMRAMLARESVLDVRVASGAAVRGPDGSTASELERTADDRADAAANALRTHAPRRPRTTPEDRQTGRGLRIVPDVRRLA